MGWGEITEPVTNEGWPGAQGERAGREGDSQPMPTIHSGVSDIQSAVIADIEARRELGIRRYGTPLQPHNGRDAMVDAYEEALDLAMYLKQRIVEESAGRAYTGALEQIVQDCSPIHYRLLLNAAAEMANVKTHG